jgi:membrane protease YdiL (CAAX protease family)
LYKDKFKLAVCSLILAAGLWILVFLIRPMDFWFLLSLSTATLLIVSVLINRDGFSVHVNVEMFLVGVLSAVLLYAFFYSGFQLTKLNPIFREGVSRVYGLRSSTSGLIIGLALVFPIAPGEEIYWRGLVQRRFMEKLGAGTGLVLAACTYALVHLPTLNPPLILTAFIGGAVWGYIYKETRSLVPAIISHILFDLLIFVIAPLI